MNVEENDIDYWKGRTVRAETRAITLREELEQAERRVEELECEVEELSSGQCA